MRNNPTDTPAGARAPRQRVRRCISNERSFPADKTKAPELQCSCLCWKAQQLFQGGCRISLRRWVVLAGHLLKGEHPLCQEKQNSAGIRTRPRAGVCLGWRDASHKHWAFHKDISPQILIACLRLGKWTEATKQPPAWPVLGPRPHASLGGKAWQGSVAIYQELLALNYTFNNVLCFQKPH